MFSDFTDGGWNNGRYAYYILAHLRLNIRSNASVIGTRLVVEDEQFQSVETFVTSYFQSSEGGDITLPDAPLDAFIQEVILPIEADTLIAAMNQRLSEQRFLEVLAILDIVNLLPSLSTAQALSQGEITQENLLYGTLSTYVTLLNQYDISEACSQVCTVYFDVLLQDMLKQEEDGIFSQLVYDIKHTICDTTKQEVYVILLYEALHKATLDQVWDGAIQTVNIINLILSMVDTVTKYDLCIPVLKGKFDQILVVIKAQLSKVYETICQDQLFRLCEQFKLQDLALLIYKSTNLVAQGFIKDLAWFTTITDLVYSFLIFYQMPRQKGNSDQFFKWILKPYENLVQTVLQSGVFSQEAYQNEIARNLYKIYYRVIIGYGTAPNYIIFPDTGRLFRLKSDEEAPSYIYEHIHIPTYFIKAIIHDQINIGVQQLGHARVMQLLIFFESIYNVLISDDVYGYKIALDVIEICNYEANFFRDILAHITDKLHDSNWLKLTKRTCIILCKIGVKLIDVLSELNEQSLVMSLETIPSNSSTQIINYTRALSKSMSEIIVPSSSEDVPGMIAQCKSFALIYGALMVENQLLIAQEVIIPSIALTLKGLLQTEFSTAVMGELLFEMAFKLKAKYNLSDVEIGRPLEQFFLSDSWGAKEVSDKKQYDVMALEVLYVHLYTDSPEVVFKLLEKIFAAVSRKKSLVISMAAISAFTKMSSRYVQQSLTTEFIHKLDEYLRQLLLIAKIKIPDMKIKSDEGVLILGLIKDSTIFMTAMLIQLEKSSINKSASSLKAHLVQCFNRINTLFDDYLSDLQQSEACGKLSIEYREKGESLLSGQWLQKRHHDILRNYWGFEKRADKHGPIHFDLIESETLRLAYVEKRLYLVVTYDDQSYSIALKNVYDTDENINPYCFRLNKQSNGMWLCFKGQNQGVEEGALLLNVGCPAKAQAAEPSDDGQSAEQKAAVEPFASSEQPQTVLTRMLKSAKTFPTIWTKLLNGEVVLQEADVLFLEHVMTNHEKWGVPKKQWKKVFKNMDTLRGRLYPEGFTGQSPLKQLSQAICMRAVLSAQQRAELDLLLQGYCESESQVFRFLWAVFLQPEWSTIAPILSVLIEQTLPSKRISKDGLSAFINIASQHPPAERYHACFRFFIGLLTEASIPGGYVMQYHHTSGIEWCRWAYQNPDIFAQCVYRGFLSDQRVYQEADDNFLSDMEDKFRFRSWLGFWGELPEPDQLNLTYLLFAYYPGLDADLSHIKHTFKSYLSAESFPGADVQCDTEGVYLTHAEQAFKIRFEQLPKKKTSKKPITDIIASTIETVSGAYLAEIASMQQRNTILDTLMQTGTVDDMPWDVMNNRVFAQEVYRGFCTTKQQTIGFLTKAQAFLAQCGHVGYVDDETYKAAVHHIAEKLNEVDLFSVSNSDEDRITILGWLLRFPSGALPRPRLVDQWQQDFDRADSGLMQRIAFALYMFSRIQEIYVKQLLQSIYHDISCLLGKGVEVQADPLMVCYDRYSLSVPNDVNFEAMWRFVQSLRSQFLKVFSASMTGNPLYDIQYDLVQDSLDIRFHPIVTRYNTDLSEQQSIPLSEYEGIDMVDTFCRIRDQLDAYENILDGSLLLRARLYLGRQQYDFLHDVLDKNESCSITGVVAWLIYTYEQLDNGNGQLYQNFSKHTKRIDALTILINHGDELGDLIQIAQKNGFDNVACSDSMNPCRVVAFKDPTHHQKLRFVLRGEYTSIGPMSSCTINQGGGFILENKGLTIAPTKRNDVLAKYYIFEPVTNDIDKLIEQSMSGFLLRISKWLGRVMGGNMQDMLLQCLQCWRSKIDTGWAFLGKDGNRIVGECKRLKTMMAPEILKVLVDHGFAPISEQGIEAPISPVGGAPSSSTAYNDIGDDKDCGLR